MRYENIVNTLRDPSLPLVSFKEASLTTLNATITKLGHSGQLYPTKAWTDNVLPETEVASGTRIVCYNMNAFLSL